MENNSKQSIFSGIRLVIGMISIIVAVCIVVFALSSGYEVTGVYSDAEGNVTELLSLRTKGIIVGILMALAGVIGIVTRKRAEVAGAIISLILNLAAAIGLFLSIGAGIVVSVGFVLAVLFVIFYVITILFGLKK